MPVLDGLLKDQVRGDPDIAGMLTRYNGSPAFFYQKSPQDTDAGWTKPCFPRVDYNVDMRYDPERKVSGAMTVNIWCTAESAAMPEDIERRLIELINGTFYTNRQSATLCAVWNRSDAFAYEMPANVGGNTAPEVIGITLTFDLLEFPEQLTTDPDPVQGLNLWVRDNFPGMNVINLDNTLPVWKPTDENPAIYWRFEGTATGDQQSYAVTWYNGTFAAHVIAQSVTERNRWTKAIIERLQRDGEVLLADSSPMFAKRIEIRHNADPLREGQLLLLGQYGVLEQQRKEYAQPPLNNAIIPNLKMEVRADAKKH